MTPFVLGISSHFHDAAAALVQGDHIIAAAQEERFSRKKGDWSFPRHSIEFCLEALPPGQSLSAVAYYENPTLKVDRILRNCVGRAPRGAALWEQTLTTLRAISRELPGDLLSILGDPKRVFFVPHHRSHAAAAFYPAPFDAAAVLVVDGVGEWSTTTLWKATSAGMTAISEMKFPHSLGMFYSAFTQYCGFRVNSGEYKLMGLSPFGNPRYRDKILDEVIDLKSDGSFRLNMSYFRFDTALSTISPKFEQLLGGSICSPDEEPGQHHMDVAASAQAVLETALIRLGKTALNITGQRNLCFAGGVALNCVANSRMLREIRELDSLWVQPAAGDAGGALGCALEVAQSMRKSQRSAVTRPTTDLRRDKMQGCYLGPIYSEDTIAAELRNANLVFETPTAEDLCSLTAEALRQGQIVGHFDGRMEFGPRALGNRSILADPRPAGTLRRVNLRIKFREGWRPFAPIVLEDHAAEVFEPPTHSPYMLFVARMKDKFQGNRQLRHARGAGLYAPDALQAAVTSDFSAVSHVDFTSRLQTLGPNDGTRCFDILSAFHAITGCPMLLNTSFNVRGEPIICSPKDAIGCFLNTHLDLLAIGPFLVRKSAQENWVKARVAKRKYDAD